MENELAQRVPRRGPVVRLTEAVAPLPRRCGSSPPPSLVCVRALPAGEPAEGRAFHARYSKWGRTNGPARVLEGVRSEACVDLLSQEVILTARHEVSLIGRTVAGMFRPLEFGLYSTE